MNISQIKASSADFAWCRFEARQQNSIIIQYVILVLQLGILGLITIAVNRAKRLGKLKQLINIYKLIIAWLFCFFIKTLLNIFAYFQYIGKSEGGQNISTQIKIPLKILSGTFLLFDLLTTFFLQTVMIYIPYLWICNVLNVVKDEHFNLQQQKAISIRFKMKNTIKTYMLIRLIYPLLQLVMCLLLIILDDFSSYTHFLWIIATIQSFVIICVYVSGYLTYSLLKDKLCLQKATLKSMLIEYLILMGCCLTRIIINTMFYFSSIIDYQPDSNCYDNHDANQTQMNCIFLALGLTLMHAIPGILIIYVYWPNLEKERSLTDSFLIKSNRNEQEN